MSLPLRTASIAAASDVKWNGIERDHGVEAEEAGDAEPVHAVVEFDPGAELNGIGRDREVAFGADVRISLEQTMLMRDSCGRFIGGGV